MVGDTRFPKSTDKVVKPTILTWGRLLRRTDTVTRLSCSGGVRRRSIRSQRNLHRLVDHRQIVVYRSFDRCGNCADSEVGHLPGKHALPDEFVLGPGGISGCGASS